MIFIIIEFYVNMCVCTHLSNYFFTFKPGKWRNVFLETKDYRFHACTLNHSVYIYNLTLRINEFAESFVELSLQFLLPRIVCVTTVNFIPTFMKLLRKLKVINTSLFVFLFVLLARKLAKPYMFINLSAQITKLLA